MSRAKPYTVAGHTYTTQGELELTVRMRLDAAPLNEQFKSTFLADVINTLDERVKDSGQLACGAFQRLSCECQIERGLDPRPGPLLLAQFEPSGRFLPVSAYPWRRRQRDHSAEVVEAMRALLSLYLPRPGSDKRCAECGSMHEVQAWYPDGQFEQIADECLDRMTLEEIESRLGFNRFAPGRDSLLNLLPAAHPAVRHLLQSHAQFEWRCHLHREQAPAEIRFAVRTR